VRRRRRLLWRRRSDWRLSTTDHCQAALAQLLSTRRGTSINQTFDRFLVKIANLVESNSDLREGHMTLENLKIIQNANYTCLFFFSETLGF
jgi:hypothetical protein